MQLWQMDLTASCFLVDGTECKIVTGVDDHSRYCVIATVVPRGSGRAVCLAFVRALPPSAVPTRCSPTFKLGGALMVFVPAGRGARITGSGIHLSSLFDRAERVRLLAVDHAGRWGLRPGRRQSRVEWSLSCGDMRAR